MAVVSGFSEAMPPPGCQNCDVFNGTWFLPFESIFNPDGVDDCGWQLHFIDNINAGPCPLCPTGFGPFSGSYALDLLQTFDQLGNVIFIYRIRLLTDSYAQSFDIGKAQFTQTEADFDCYYSGPLNANVPIVDHDCFFSSNPVLSNPGCHIELDVNITPVP